MSRYKVSFILPAYKRRFLKEAIASILAQTYRDFELVVVDDCSPDGLKEMVDQFQDARLAYYRNECNLGGKDLIAAWNKAMEYATGEYCVLASDDDVYEPHYLEKMMEAVKKYPNVDVFHCRFAFIDGEGVIKGLSEPRTEFETGISMIYNRGVRRMEQRAPDFLFRRSALEKIGGFVAFPRAWYSDDATWMRLSCGKGCVCVPDVLFYWRVSGENISCKSNDVDEKIRAGLMYKEWVAQLLRESRPQNEADSYMLRECQSRLMSAIDGGMRYEMRTADFRTWWKAIRTNKIDRGLVLRFIKDRVKDCLS